MVLAFFLHCVTVLLWTTPAVTEAFLWPAAPCGRLKARGTVSAVSESEAMNMLQKQVALAEGQVALADQLVEQLKTDKEWLRRELSTAKAEISTAKAEMNADKNETVSLLKDSNNKLVSALIEAKENLETELAIAKAEKNAVVNTRLVVAIAAKSVFPTAKSTTIATKELAKLLKVNYDLENNQLTDQAMAWLEDLHGEVPDKDLVKSVCSELRDLYHTLSLDRHFPDGPSPDSPGLYIWNAKQPTKYASALEVLKALDACKFPNTIGPVFYLDAKSKVASELTRSGVKDVAHRT